MKRSLLLTFLGLAIFLTSSLLSWSATHSPTLYYHGSADDSHDAYYAGLVNADRVIFGNYCTYNESSIDLLQAVKGDVVISGKAGSEDCIYRYWIFTPIPIVGDDNACDEQLGNSPLAIFITNGCDWGEQIDFYVPSPSLSESMTIMANYIIALNNAADHVLNIFELSYVLGESSTVDEIRDGRWYGQHIDIDKAIELVSPLPPPPPPPPCIGSGCGFIPGAILQPLLLQ